jgi:hypothetical protein
MATPTQLLASAAVIKNETVPGANTALRLGTMFEDIINSNVNNYLTFNVRLSQTGTSAPAIVREFLNTLESGSPGDSGYIGVLWFRNSTGEYKVRIRTSTSVDAKITNGYSYAVSFSDAKARLTGFTNGNDGTYNFTEFTFRTYNVAGTLADDVLVFTNLLIQYYAW